MTAGPTLYLSGAMTGLPGFNRPAFHAAAGWLRAAGYTVVNPAEMDGDSWEHHMRRDIKALMDCDGVALLPGWQRSRGSRLEVFMALALDMRVLPFSCWMEEAV